MKPTAYLVTGASNGIGAAIARSLLDAGHTVVNIDYRLPEAPPAGLVSFQADLTDASQTEAVAREVTERYAIVGLVNNAGARGPARPTRPRWPTWTMSSRCICARPSS